MQSSAVPAPVRVVQTGRRLNQHSKGSPSPPPSSPPSSPSGNWKGDWKGDKKEDKKEDKKDNGKKDPNQCWNRYAALTCPAFRSNT